MIKYKYHYPNKQQKIPVKCVDNDKKLHNLKYFISVKIGRNETQYGLESHLLLISEKD
jgi:hypothetical protein